MFSVEKVTKDFYKDIANWYFWAVQKSQFPEGAEQEENGRNIAIIRLITRLIFIWFMRERSLVPNDLFNQVKIKNYLKTLSPEDSTYYKAILQNLFFATLSTKQNQRKYASEKRFNKGWNEDYGNQYVFRYHEFFKNSEDIRTLFKDIPFLNGGLFECLDNKKDNIIIDGFSRVKKNQPIVSNFLFFSDEQEADLNTEYGTKKKKYKVRGIIDILSSYNFTIDENDPNDAEVALDPELLGKVFENLLASFNPETSSTARKATGSYYTPREIVDYMVTQSLKEYFKTNLGKIEKIDDKLDELFANGQSGNPFNSAQSKKLVVLIDNLRIVDPAVGSGAFPMGILNKLVHILGKLDSENKLWKEAQIKAVKNNVSDPVLQKKLTAQIEEQFTNKNFDYGRKLYLIQKCIYGVDIQQTAVEIAKLRFFIALLVDEKIDKEKENWGIEPLPNLDFKIMQGNSLISEFMGIDFDNGEKDDGQLFSDNQKVQSLIDEFQQKKNEFQNESDKDKKQKLKQEIDDLMIQIFENKLKKQKQDYFAKLKAIEDKYSTLPNKQQREEIISKEKQALSKKEGFDLNKFESQLREFSGKTKVKPFFAWKLYFAEVFQGDNPGFDIVIGNPPYIQLQKAIDSNNNVHYADLYKDLHFQTFDRTGDMYCLFYEQGNNLLQNKGHLIFITSNKWMRAGYGQKLRKYFTENTIPKILLDLGPGVFETATVDTNILLFQKGKFREDTKCLACDIKVDLAKENIKLENYIEENKIELTKFSEEAWIILNPAEQAIKEKIEKIGTPLKDWDIKINRGVLTGYNEAFIIDGKKKDELIAQDPKSAEIIKPILRGKDIKRYYADFADKWLIATLPAMKLNIGDYPAIKEYLASFGKKLEQTGKKYINEKGKEQKSRKKTGNKWFETQDQINYYKEFKKEKIVWGNIAYEASFTFDKGSFINAPANLLTSEKHNVKYLVSIMNSKIFSWEFENLGISLGRAFEWKKQYVEKIHIPQISESAQKPFIDLVDKILEITSRENYDPKNPPAEQKDLEKQIDEMVYELYGLTPEEIAIVEGK